MPKLKKHEYDLIIKVRGKKLYEDVTIEQKPERERSTLEVLGVLKMAELTVIKKLTDFTEPEKKSKL